MFRLAHSLPRPLIVAHRGASGLLPEQTLQAFDLAVTQGADAIELDIVPARDGVLLARHENELSATTNVVDLPMFSDRQTRRTLEGVALDGWFSEEFTAQEIQSLRARQRFTFRDHASDDRFAIPTLDAVLRWRSALSRSIQIFIEIKHPTHFENIGLPIHDMLIQTLGRHDLLGRGSGIVLMSFEPQILRELRSATDLPLIQLLDAPDARPFDWTIANNPRTYADLLTVAGLGEVATYADGIGPWKRLIVSTMSAGADGIGAEGLRLAPATSLITDAHAAGLFVCAWTFRDEPQFLATDYAANPLLEYEQFLQLRLDALITDFPATARKALMNRT